MNSLPTPADKPRAQARIKRSEATNLNMGDWPLNALIASGELTARMKADQRDLAAFAAAEKGGQR